MSADKLNLNIYSFATRAERAKADEQGRLHSSLVGVQLLQAFYPATEAGAKGPEVLQRLASQLPNHKNLQTAFGGLNAEDQAAIRKQVGAQRLDEIFSIAQNSNPNQLWREATQFGVRLKFASEIPAAIGVLGAITQAGTEGGVPGDIRAQAEAEFNAMVGKGKGNLRAEFLLGQFAHQATDKNVIVPMIAGSAVFSLARTATLGRLVTAGEGLLTRGWGARITAGVVGTAVEVPTFSLLSRSMVSLSEGGVAWDAHSVGRDLLGAGITLGALKLFGFAGHQAWGKVHGVGELGMATRLTGLAKHSQGAFSQGAMLAGMISAHKLEEGIGLRPHVDGATTLMDSTASLVSLGVGGHLGRKLLGRNWARFEQEMNQRAKLYDKALGSESKAGQSPMQWLNSVVGTAVPVTGIGAGGLEGRPEPGRNGIVSMMMEGMDEGAPPSGSGNGPSRPDGRPARPIVWLTLKHDNGRASLRVTEEFLPQAQRLWDGRTAEAGETELATVGAFLKTVLDAPVSPTLCAEARAAILGDVLFHFHRKFVGDNDIHAVTRSLPNQADLLRAYNHAAAEVRYVTRPKSALLEAAKRGEVGLFAQFGGQANAYFQELRNIYEAYPVLRPLIQQVGETLKQDAASKEAQEQGFYTEGLDVMRWLENPESTPDAKYLASSAVSQPLIGLTQMAHYYNTFKTLGVSPGELRELTKGTTGHSQGIMSSVVVASSATEAEFIQNTQKAARYLLWQGIRMQQVSPETTLNPDIVAESVAAGDGVPTPMLGLLKLTPETVQKYVERVNKKLPPERQVELSLINGPRAVVVSGHPESLHRLREALRKDEAKGDQGRVPFSERKLEFVANYFPVSAEFHSRYMNGVPDLLAKDVDRLGLSFNTSELAIPVYNTLTGDDLRQSPKLSVALILQQSVWPVNWEAATAAAHADQGVTHVIDFGPGGTAGIGSITARNKEGTGVQVILAGGLQGTSALLDKSYLFDSNPASVRKAPHWAKDYEPKLVRLPDGTLMVDTKFTRLIGKPPVMAAGMTPTSANESFVNGVINAGFHGELAGGGQHTEKYFRDRVDTIMKAVPAGEGITTNLLFLNAYLWGFQYPLVEVMAGEGKPMDGVTIAAGVPTLETATEVLTKLREAGIRHVSFKPGAIGHLKQVIEIAKANPESQVILQWTGGRAGGHHSFEDMHQPMLETYAAIRRQKNITLVAGSGLGDAKDSLPYLTGEWSEAFGSPKMPFDGILLASRLMVAKEALTADEAKELIAQSPGIEKEGEWEGSYKKSVGGVTTVISELGEPIHKIANRGILLWKEFDEKYFGLKPEERQAAILKDKDEIIRRINTDYQKLYFGQKADGKVSDLSEMSYLEVANRMLDLMYVSEPYPGNPPRWMDVTFRDRVYDFMVRIEDRFHPRGKDSVALLQSPKDIEADPYGMLAKLMEKYGAAGRTLISSEDIDYFLNLCKRPGKPVNFVPVIDGDLHLWFKKDSLWQSEDLEATPGHDVGRVAILQGPLAVRYSSKANEPIADIMGGINQGFIDALKEKYPSEDAIPKVEYLGGAPIQKIAAKDLPNVKITEAQWSEDPGPTRVTAEMPAKENDLPEGKAWLEFLSGEQYSWLRAFLTTPRVVQDRTKVDNPMARLFRPRPGQKIEVMKNDSGKPESVRIFDAGKDSPALEAGIDGDKITVTINHERPVTADAPAQLIPLQLFYRYNPKQGYAPIHEIMEGRNDRIKEFYSKLWFGQAMADDLKVTDVLQASRTVTRQDINDFRRSIGNTQAAYVDKGQEKLQAPLDLAILLGWEPLIKTIFPKTIDGDIFKLVHLSNGFRVLDDAPLLEGDKVDTEMRILEVRNTPGGKRISVQGMLTRNGKAYVELNSQFFIRGQFSDFENTFHTIQESREVTLDKAETLAILQSKNWFRTDDGVELKVGDRLVFELETREEFKDKDVRARTATKGVVTRDGQKVGEVDLTALNVQANLVHAYLARAGQPVNAAVFFETGGYPLMAESDVVTAPKDNQPYAIASRDLNPIHVNPYIADLAGLPTTIIHGMWTSANARRVVETVVAKNHPERVVDFKATFTDMVNPGDTLSTQLNHVGMRNGRSIVEVETVNQDGKTVLKATAEVAAPPTAYVFTGQGSAEPGMGMDLYASSPVAKQIWDRADKHLKNTLGFSILEIVKNNPKQLTLSFGGPKGAKVRDNLRKLSMEIVVEEGGQKLRKQVPIFPEITETSETYSFRHPEGLLFATQFTQPAITLLEMAAYADMRAKGLVPTESIFAGHSLGEYAGLSTVGKVLPVETVAELVFLRGMTMQGAVARDSEGRSPYRMAAINPFRVGAWLNEATLKEVVAAVAKHSGQPLEIVNYNVENQQYIAAGEAGNIDILYQLLKGLKADRAKLKDLDSFVPSVIAEVRAKRAGLETGASIIPDPGKSSIPPSIVLLPGIDVPFHSTVLRDGVPAFRSMLVEKMPKNIDIENLVGKYIPNLLAKPFSLEKDYVQEAADYTKSPQLNYALEHWDEVSKNPQELGRVLLIELLAYQFASPVRWIETQDQIFGKGVERFIEVGPVPTLSTMAKRTLAQGKDKYPGAREILMVKTDQDAIYFTGAAPAPAAPAKKADEAPKAATPPPAAKPAAAAPAPVVVAPPPAPASAGPAIADAKPTALEALQVLLAVKLKKPVSEIGPQTTIKDLVGGKSAVQNEIFGDLQKEFGPGPDNSAELKLEALAATIGAAYTGAGKQSSAQIDKMVAAKMPGGFGKAQISAYLASERRLGEGRVQGVLLHALSMEPGARLGSETEAKAWLDQVVDSYGQKVGQAIPKGAAPAAGVAMPVAMAAGPAAQPVPDAPVTALEVLRAMLAVKLKKGSGEIGPNATIKDLVGGKSAVQNEIFGELQKEFGAGPDNSAELPLAKLAELIGASYKQLGKVSSGNIAKLMAAKMPGGFGVGQAKAYLSSERLLGEGRADGVLALGLTMEPPARLGSETEAKAWLDSVADAYASAQGITVPRASQGGGGGAVMVGGGGVDPAALKAFRAEQERLIGDFMKAYSDFLGKDPRAGEHRAEMEAELRKKAEAELAMWVAEHGEFYSKGIVPIFDSWRLRDYDSYWNLAKQDALELYHDLDTGRIKLDHPSVNQKAQLIINRASPDLVKLIEFHAEKAKTEGKQEIGVYFQMLAKEVRANLDKPATYHDRHPQLMPHLEITPEGEQIYKEIPRPGITNPEAYVAEMRAGAEFPVTQISEGEARQSLQSSVDSLRNAITQLKMQQTDPIIVSGLERELMDLEGRLHGKVRMPHLYLKKPLETDANVHVYDPDITNTYLNTLERLAKEGVSFKGKTYLAVGAGANSIAIEVVKNLLAGGATVVTTTLFGTKQEADFYQDVYEKYGAKGSRLITLPMNQGSVQDTEALVKFIYAPAKGTGKPGREAFDPVTGLGLDLDGIIPFAALPENGRDIGNIDSRSEFSHRMMLTNVIRLLGAVKNAKQERGIDTRPAHVILPMSPNHGLFGSDGLYAESKIGLEPLFNKWKSEGWGPYLSIAGAAMGWTRGTGVMAPQNVVAPGMEKLGARTFSAADMAFNLTGLFHPDMIHEAQKHPVWADLLGGFSALGDLKQVNTELRVALDSTVAKKKAVTADALLDSEVLGTTKKLARQVAPKANFESGFPKLPSTDAREALKQLRGMLDLEKVVVVTGFGEVGPWGGAKTRWQMESQGEFSLEGVMELAWVMGLIKYHNGQGKDGKPYTGWVDAKSNDPVPDHKVKELYEKAILEHTGIRMVEPQLFEGYDPHKKLFLREVQMTRDLPPIEISNKEEAEAFKLEQGDKVDVYEKDGQWYAQFKAGAILHIPKALRFDRFVAGQIPTGWNPASYGIPKGVIDQVDPTTLYILVSTIEALISAGIRDPYEFYKYIHVSELSNTQGGGMGGMRAIRRAFRERMLEKPVQGDILQEQLINVMPAWVNMLLLSSSGPIKTPVGACATAAESVEMGVLDILSGKAKIAFVGGYDDYSEEGSYEFGQMQATSNTREEIAKGRVPKEMSRPTTTTRSGFTEAQGAGAQILMSADMALKMGLPIYGVVALTHTASDKQGESVPAPGQGVLTMAKEKPGEFENPLLEMEYRRQQIEMQKKNVAAWVQSEQDRGLLKAEKLRAEQGEEKAKAYEAYHRGFVEKEAKRQEQALLAFWNHDFFKGNSEIAPLRGALAMFGLTIDDIAVTSFHGTSTEANDKNESGVLHQQMAHLGRSAGNPLFVIGQKWLTGHPKGAAAAWMFNGLMQTILSGIIPGIRSADNTDPMLAGNTHLVYPNRTIRTAGIKAGLLQSFGFGQAGAQVLVLHPDFLLGAIEDAQYQDYSGKRDVREAGIYRHMQEALTNKRLFMKIKEAPPYSVADEAKIYLDPTARAVPNPETGSWYFPPANGQKPDDKKGGSIPPPSGTPPSGGDDRPTAPPPASGGENGRYGQTPQVSAKTKLEVALRKAAEGERPRDPKNNHHEGIGVDAQSISEINIGNSDFIEKNFTPAEQTYCVGAAHPPSSFAGRWAAKEAVIKAISDKVPNSASLWKGSEASLKDIEILPAESGAVQVVLHGHAKQVAEALGIQEIQVSISHSGDHATAVAKAR